MKFSDWWERNFLRNEFFAAVALAAGTASLLAHDNWQVMDELLTERRPDLYGVAASIFGALLGFSITTMSIVAGIVGGERFQRLQRSAHYNDLWRTFVAAIRALALAIVVSLACLVGDRDDDPRRWLSVLFVFASLHVALRTWRAVWVLHSVLRIRSEPPPQ